MSHPLRLPSLVLLAAFSPLMFPVSSRAERIEVALVGGGFSGTGRNLEVSGEAFSISFGGLPEGDYTVEVTASEHTHDAIGKRVMTVVSGEVILGENIDLLKATGGRDKPVVLRAKVKHEADSIRGPLQVTFSSSAGTAKFDSIRILNATEKKVAGTDAATLKKNREGAEFDAVPKVSEPEIWKDSALTPEVRADDLIRRLSVNEKVAQLMMNAPRIPRLGIPAYHWWNECLHGVARAGTATVFPQAIGAAATWDTDLWHAAADAMSDEARAKHHDSARKHKGDSAEGYGLDAWSPNVNIFRDPRWGRGQETYGEDPYLTGRMGVAYVKGLQGDDPQYFKVIATPKHFAVHSGPEKLRHTFDAKISDQDLWETYLPAFESCVVEGKAYSVMGAYNRVNGESATSDKRLLIDILRDKWGFSGYTVSDVDSVGDIFRTHRIVKTAAEAAAHALRNGMDLNGGATYRALPEALRKKLVTEADIDRALKRVLLARFKLGMFDPAEKVKYARIPMNVNDSPEHDAIALQVARESFVLLKNAGNTLPFPKTGTVAVIGPNATETGRPHILFGSYAGNASHPVGFLAGITAKLAGKATVLHARGCDHVTGTPAQHDEALAIAAKADRIVMVMGISPVLEGEENPRVVPGFPNGDRSTIGLPEVQKKLIAEIVALGKPVALVLCSGSALAIPEEDKSVPAILAVWYSGQRGGDAGADVLFGDYNPAGRLPVTFYRSDKDLPAFTDYGMKGRTYRYFTGEPLYGFGHGLSYTTFTYSGVRLETAAGDRIVSVDVANTGKVAGDEVVQLYLGRNDAPADSGLPLRSLRGFKRLHLKPGEKKTVTFRLTPFQFAFANKAGVRVAEGAYTVGIGGSRQAAQSVTVKFEAPVENPPYAHTEPSVK